MKKKIQDLKEAKQAMLNKMQMNSIKGGTFAKGCVMQGCSELKKELEEDR